MGNETTAEPVVNVINTSHSSSTAIGVSPTKPIAKSKDDKNVKHDSYFNIKQFQCKWLKSIRIVPLLISNKVYGMNKGKEHFEQNIAYKSDNRLKEFYFSHYQSLD